MNGRTMRAISLRESVFTIIEAVKNEITAERQSVNKHAREATFSEAVWAVLKESGRVPTK